MLKPTGIDSMKLINKITQAHLFSGAPGQVVGYFADGRYKVRLQYGEKIFRFVCLSDGRVRVFCKWTICGDRQRKQATSK